MVSTRGRVLKACSARSSRMRPGVLQPYRPVVGYSYNSQLLRFVFALRLKPYRPVGVE